MARGKKIMVVASICLFALLLATAGSAVVESEETQEERPLRIHGEATVVIDWEQSGVDADGRPFVPWTMTASQLSTEGWSANEGTGIFYLDTFISEGSGVSTELNGDTLAWDSVEEFGTQHATITFTSGTGQFENAVGEFTFDYTVLSSEVNEEDNPVKIVYSFWGAGSITY